MDNSKALNAIYYQLRPLIPRSLQIFLRRQIAARKYKLYAHVWPINPKAAAQPEDWSGWLDNKRFALVLTHDVDSACGQEKCAQLMETEKRLGFRSAFYFVPERYDVSEELRNHLTSNGFEVGVHGLKHDGKLYSSKKVFEERASAINRYLREWKAVGFRSPSMHHNLDWLHELNIEYDASTFDTCPFEPQPDGVGTIFPFVVFSNRVQRSGFSVQGYSSSSVSSSPPSFFVELPYTLAQDFNLFVILREKTINIWKEKLDWIADKGGMALLLAHPDYMNFGGNRLSIEEYPSTYYEEFLDYIKAKYQGQYWHALPKEIARFWVSNMVGE